MRIWYCAGLHLSDTSTANKVAPMMTLKVGIASYEEMKARTLAVARGTLRVAPDDPRVWFTSTEAVAKVLSGGDSDLLRLILEPAPLPDDPV